MRMNVSSNIKCAELQAVIIRADGTREQLGSIAYFHSNPLKRLGWRLKKMFSKK